MNELFGWEIINYEDNQYGYLNKKGIKKKFPEFKGAFDSKSF